MDNSILATIGNTPLVKLNSVPPDDCAEIWIKLEGGNPTGSYKDRMAVSLLLDALDTGKVENGDRIIEFTGGSTGTALAFVSAALGLNFTAVFSDAFSDSKRQAMVAFGAEVLIEKSDGTITPELVQRMKKRAYDLAEKPRHYYADQFGSPKVREGYKPMGAEIVAAIGGDFDVYCAGIGTGGAIMGASDGMLEAGCSARFIGLEPLQSPLLTTGTGGPHMVEGIGVGFYPPYLEDKRLGDVRAIDQEQAFDMSRRLAREEGIFCGGSTGLNVTGAIEIGMELGPGARVVTVGVDNGTKYLGGHIYG